MKTIDVEQGMICAAQCWDIYEEALMLYLDRLVPMITEIGDYLEAKDYEKVRMLAHSLRGMSGTVGAMALQAQAEEMERAVLNNESDLLMKLYTPLKERAAQAQQAALILLDEMHEAIDGNQDNLDHDP